MTESPAKKVSFIALTSTLALIFSYVEILIPFNLGIPGIKIGIANVVIILALYLYDFKTAFFVNFIRIVLAGLLFNGFFAAIYSLAGGLLSLFIMYLLKNSKKFSLTAVSMCGGVFHNLGQITIAAIIVESPKLFLYFPVLIFSGMITGTAVGILAYFILNKLPGNSLPQ